MGCRFTVSTLVLLVLFTSGLKLNLSEATEPEDGVQEAPPALLGPMIGAAESNEIDDGGPLFDTDVAPPQLSVSLFGGSNPDSPVASFLGQGVFISVTSENASGIYGTVILKKKVSAGEVCATVSEESATIIATLNLPDFSSEAGGDNVPLANYTDIIMTDKGDTFPSDTNDRYCYGAYYFNQEGFTSPIVWREVDMRSCRTSTTPLPEGCPASEGFTP